MLDDPQYLKEKDPDGALTIAAQEPDQLRTKFTLDAQFGEIANVVHAGMGGSALPAQLLRSWPVLPVPFEIVRDYDLPAYVGKHTLCIIDSYSGNTEETISALDQALSKGAQVVVVAHGGQLETLATDKKVPFVKLPEVGQPRFAVYSNLKAVLAVFVAAGLVKADEVYPVVDACADFLEREVPAWIPAVPTANNSAKQLAQELLGKSLVVYAGPKLQPAAQKWKICTNENAKQVAWWNQLPEFNHNEFIGWSKQPVDKPYAIIDLRSDLEHPRIQKRFEVSARLLSGMRPEPHIVQAKGSNVFEQLIWTITYGDFVTLYLALLNGINPTPVDLVESFKKALG
ncbi:MAG TPA: bifunctional phosphoglucose/phosphomannose isomerase [Candidatus Saccharimonadales bacterium]|nr:bifunctional phosphoglucose/phosphomannose isomerase [Candidatus Saccharimonadales bacterium]